MVGGFQGDQILAPFKAHALHLPTQLVMHKSTTPVVSLNFFSAGRSELRCAGKTADGWHASLS